MNFDDYSREVGSNLDFYSNSLVDIGNGIFLSNREIDVLKSYDINYTSCKNLKEIIRRVEDTIDEVEDSEELEDISFSISERDYYQNTNK